MPNFIADVICRANLTADNEAAAREVADEIAKEVASLMDHPLVYETAVGAIRADQGGGSEDPEMALLTASKALPAEQLESLAWAMMDAAGIHVVLALRAEDIREDLEGDDVPTDFTDAEIADAIAYTVELDWSDFGSEVKGTVRARLDENREKWGKPGDTPAAAGAEA